jgi:hypothetical protein
MILTKHTFQMKYTYDGYYYKESFPSHWHMLLLAANHKAQQLVQKL